MNLDDIIEYDEESTNLDFKKEEYNKKDYVSLIKDISSMANALNSEIKRIVVGIKHKSGEDKEVIGVEKLLPAESPSGARNPPRLLIMPGLLRPTREGV